MCALATIHFGGGGAKDYFFQNVTRTYCIIRLTMYLSIARRRDHNLKGKTEEFVRFVFHKIRVPFNSTLKDAVESRLRLCGDKSNTNNEHYEIAHISSKE